MKKIAILFSLYLVCFGGFAQTLKKYDLGASGCSAYFFCDPGAVDVAYSLDSSVVYTAECISEETTYGALCVKLNEGATTSDLSAAEETLLSYMDFLKIQLKIVSSAGYGKGHRLKEREDTRGVIDYWTAEDKYNWKVKGWTDGKFIVVMYATTLKEIPETKVNVFLDGLRFPGM